MEEINIPKVTVMDYEIVQFATEAAFMALLKRADYCGLKVQPVTGLMYLPNQEVTEAFIEACKNILLILTPTNSHVKDSDGNESFAVDTSE